MVKTNTDLAERLIVAGTASDAEITSLVDEVGLEEITQALVKEILFRCDEPVNAMPVNLALETIHKDKKRRTVLRVLRNEPIQSVDDRDPVIRALLSMRVIDLVRRLYGRSGHRRTGDFSNSFLPTAPTGGNAFLELSEILTSATQATSTIMSGCSTHCPDLGSLSVRYGSDKWASFHWYTPHYEHHFAALRDEPVRVLEIGIGGYEDDLGGSSLAMWKRYFHRGMIFGLDIFDKSALNESRLIALVGDQGDSDTLAGLAKEHGPFDIIIDDGSHVNEHVHTSFHTLFPHLRSGGCYVIEDLQTAYFPGFGGSSGSTAESHTSIGLIKQLLDDLHYREHAQQPNGQPSITQSAVTGIHVYHNIVFIEKGVNGEDSLPAWMDVKAWDALGAK